MAHIKELLILMKISTRTLLLILILKVTIMAKQKKKKSRRGQKKKNLPKQEIKNDLNLFPSNPQQLSLSQEAQEDNFKSIREAIDYISIKRREIAGLPVPIPGERLIIESSHPYAPVYNQMELQANFEELPNKRNRFYSSKLRSDVVIWEEGGIRWGIIPQIHSISKVIRTAACSVAWSIEAEDKALKFLSTLIPPYLYKIYYLTGIFIETSIRSGVTYIFRKLRPTIACKPDEKDEMRILSCLCLHPIGYYADSWAGSMCPTDDVIAHLLMMRGDEHMFWKRANQIPAYMAAAGL